MCRTHPAEDRPANFFILDEILRPVQNWHGMEKSEVHTNSDQFFPSTKQLILNEAVETAQPPDTAADLDEATLICN